MSKEATITSEALRELIATAVRAEVASIMTAKSPDEKIAEEMARQRGTNRPPLPDKIVECVSPVTKATFRARLQRKDGVSGWRVVELLDYKRPDGWDRWRQDGGLVPDGVEMVNHVTHQPAPKFMWEVHKAYYKRDNDLLMGRDLPDQFRVDRQVHPDSVVLSPEDLAKLGISRDDVLAAIESKGLKDDDSKAAE